MILQNAGFALIPAHMKVLLDEIMGPNRIGVVLRECGWALGLTAATGFCMYLMRKLIIGASRDIEYALRRDLYGKLQKLDETFYRKNRTGDLISRSTNDLESVRTLLGPGIMYIPNTISRLAFFAPAMAALSPKLSILLGVLIAVLVTLIFTILPRTRGLHRRVQELTGSLNDRAWQVISGIRTVKLHTSEANEERRFGRLNEEYIRRNVVLASLQGVLWPLFLTLFAASELLLLYFGGKEVVTGRLTLSEMLQFQVMTGILAMPVLSLGWVMSMLQQGLSAMGRINRILTEPDPRAEGGGPWTPVGEDRSPPTIVARKLSHRWSADGGEVLKDLSFTIRPGETVGITGPVGCGKSTLAQLLSGTAKPARGMLFWNEVDMALADPDGLARRVSFVPQDPFLFSMSLAENVALGPDENPDMAKVTAVGARAALDRDVAGFEKGWETAVGERGVTLSGGQRQRTAIARALHHDGGLLVLDDALSSVDAATEARILEQLASRKAERTVVLFAHRLSTLKLADRILVMEEGAVVEDGSHEELLLRGGLYARLARLQQMEERLADAI